MDAKAWRQKAEASEALFAQYMRWEEKRRVDLARGPAIISREQALKQSTPAWELASKQTKEYLRLARRFSDLTDVYGPIKLQLEGKKV